jgi:alpha-ketoglutarate-dependent taurine dioxygenase
MADIDSGASIPEINLSLSNARFSETLHSAECLDSVANDGAVMLRGGPAESLTDLGHAAQQVLGTPVDYKFFVTPRRQLDSGFFSATDVAPARTIRFHNECSYLPIMPRFLLFVCRQPSETGGNTLLARTTEVALRLPSILLRLLVEQQLRYRWLLPSLADTVRKLGCTNTDEAILMLRSLGADAYVDSRSYLHISIARPGLAHVDFDSNFAWINHMWALHHSAIPATLLDVYTRQYGKDCFPHDVCFEDGSPISDEHIAAVGKAYETCSVPVRWRAGDILVLDNLKWAHARQAYEGSRELCVQMYRPTEVQSVRRGKVVDSE